MDHLYYGPKKTFYDCHYLDIKLGEGENFENMLHVTCEKIIIAAHIKHSNMNNILSTKFII